MRGHICDLSAPFMARVCACLRSRVYVTLLRHTASQTADGECLFSFSVFLSRLLDSGTRIVLSFSPLLDRATSGQEGGGGGAVKVREPV